MKSPKKERLKGNLINSCDIINSTKFVEVRIIVKYGYIRSFADSEINNKQNDELNKIENITIFREDFSNSKQRPQLENLLNTVRDGDQIYVYNLYALADSTRHLLEILQSLKKSNVSVHFSSNSLDTSESSTFPFLYILEELAQFQSEVISEKTKIGLLEAQKKGNIAGRPKKSMLSVNQAIEMYHSKKYSLEEIKAKTGISKSTLYRNLEN